MLRDELEQHCAHGCSPCIGTTASSNASNGPGCGLDPRRHERLPTVREQYDIAGLDVRRRVLEESEVVAVVGVEAVRRQRAGG